ncbi:Uncharacterized conserved protein, DUF302 family [Bryocella elongata]|uniref:Uncharacterized conserved protein, DUF302 family n=1 Tax=Bryocella elongata TaxID=863522 RepID=A0A1H5SVE7_9BACT|nr:DUF302 domain-containing protein [Bryocella elongata]SEF54536.1 Uncharacterized conserved protein, DUF302 family [Bryocella elongata]
MEPTQDNGLKIFPSKHAPAETLDRLTTALQQHGVTVFARIEHSQLAAEAGLHMPPCAVLIFGNPKAGTPVMLAAPTSSIDLPLKALAWEDADGNSYLAINTPEYLAARHNIPADLIKNLAAVTPLIEAAAL